ncbi:hypothetical protein F4780DRAFT_442981 [Xylariomycetidae sp. FL0641]|nr:hypothetical protein F4780DRAFT_442981 [Xylariomycetidae sp. FL0641]
MLGVQSTNGFKGHAYIILQVIRFCNVAVFLAIMATTVLMMVFAKLPNGFQFFGDVGLAFVLLVAGVLAYTEIGHGRGQKTIAATWPVVGPTQGFTWLGGAMFLMGCHLLGGLSRNTYTKDSVPSQVQEVILGTGIVALAFGVFNMLASVAFRNSNGTRARQLRAEGASTSDTLYHEKEYGSASSTSNGSVNSRGRFNISRPIPQGDIEHGLDAYSTDGPIDPRASPIMPELKRPPTALHPAIQGGPGGRVVSGYSEASHMDRFTMR